MSQCRSGLLQVSCGLRARSSGSPIRRRGGSIRNRRQLLSRAGIVVSIACNGQEALDKLALQRFDGVLMDCQMPVMDGYAATRGLRQQPLLHDIPIIAMTANAMVGEREKVLAAGMNDHIAKPIKIDEMFATLARWVHLLMAGASESTGVVNPGASAHALAELLGINTRAGLAGLMNDETLYSHLLCMFRDRERDFASRFKAARAVGATAAAARLAHDLRSVAATLGVDDIPQAALALELAGNDQAEDKMIHTLAENVVRLLDPVIAGLLALALESE